MIVLWIVFVFMSLTVACAQLDEPPHKGEQPFVSATRASFTLGERELKDGRFVGLALSGGGSRAAVFGAAVLKELDRVGILSQVDVLSAVSGGALPAAYYALEGYRAISFADSLMERMGYDVQREVVARTYAPHKLLRYWLTNRIEAETVIRVLDDELFHGATYADLNPAQPKLLLNATDALTGEPFVLSDENFAALHRPLAPFSIARAVYTSAAYPGLLEPIALFDGADSAGTPAPPAIIAYDGGPADNLGLRTLMTVLDQSLKDRLREDVFPRGCWIISVDATGRFDNVKHEPLSAATVLLKSHRREVLELAGIPADRQDHTKFGAFRLGRRGGDGSCRFWHLALRQLSDHDPVGVRVTRIRTNLGLERADQEALARAARILVDQARTEATSQQEGLGGFGAIFEDHPTPR
jgi:predicted acylesterase/phospholipase RssA